MEDDRQLEIEALQSIFMDQFRLLDNPNHFEITILPDPDAGPDSNTTGLILEVQFTNDYPNEIPKLLVRSWKNTISVKQCKVLQDKLEEQANEFIGMQMIYNLTQVLKDWIDEQVLDELTKQKEKERAREEIEMQKEVEEYQRRIADGTPVTRESFLAWRAKFLAEHPELPQLDVEDNKGKMTGKKIFETMSLSAITELAAKELKAAGEKTEIDWELFNKESESVDVE